MRRTAEQDWSEMSEELKAEVRASVRAGEEMFAPSPAVRTEAVRFIRPRGRSMLYLHLAHGPRPGFDGDGRLLGIKVSDELATVATASACALAATTSLVNLIDSLC